MIRRIFIALIAILVVTGPALATPPVEDAVAASEAWLKLIDAKDYAGGWKNAASVFQQGMSQADATKRIQSVRDRLGALKTRTYDAATLTKSLPGMPDGDYAIVRFQSSFENKAEALESLTLVSEGGTWKVGGYFIK